MRPPDMAARHTGGPLIVHVVNQFSMGGLENGVVNLINRLPNAAFGHAVVSLTDGTDFRARLRRSDVAVYSLGKRPGHDPRVHLRFLRLLRRLRPAIVHTRNIGTLEFQWLARLAGVRAGVHGEHGWDAADPFGRNARHRWLRRISRAVVDYWVPMSRDLERWLADSVGVDPRRVRQIYNGVDTVRFQPSGPQVALPPEWAATSAPDPITVGTVGRLDPIKNQALIVEAVALLARRAPDVAARIRMVFVGAGPSAEALRRRLAETGLAEQAWLAGADDDVPELMRRFDVFVLPSLNEGISNTILEAMATGLPVVATCVGGNAEIVVDGATGTLTKPADAAELAEAILRYAQDPAMRRTHGAAGRARVESSFSMDAMVRGYLGLYQDALGRQR